MRTINPGAKPHPTSSPLLPQLNGAMAAHDWPAAVRLARQWLRKDPRALTAHRCLGFALHRLGRATESAQAFENGRRFHPKDAELLINFGHSLLEQADNGRALPLFERVCELRPDSFVGWLKLAQCCYPMGRHRQGYEAAEKAMALASSTADRTEVLTQRAIHRRELGQIREAVQDCAEAIRINPLDTAPHTNRLLFMLSDPQAGIADVVQAAREFGQTFEAPLRSLWPTFKGRDTRPWRRLRVGFLSPDFRNHSVMYFVEGLLAQLDREQFEVWAFYLHPSSDGITERVKRHVDQFVELSGLLPNQQVERILEREIDILVDLAGHTGGNGLHALMRKPAPVQLSWLGYPATTGLSSVDYKFTDRFTDPDGAESQYSENLYRSDTFFCVYRPMIRNVLYRYQPAYLVRPTPAVSRGYVTFGSCNNLGKLTDDVLRVWARILQALPTARLLIEGKNLGLAEVADDYRHKCERLGLPLDRLDLVGLNAANQYLTYHDIDIALDPFPLTGGTTSFDTLWMGVPLVCMSGDAFKSRMSMSILAHMGRTDWIAKDADDYVRIALALAGDVQQLNLTRLGQREAMEASVLMDEPVFTRAFEDALRLMWMEWAAQRQGADTPQAVQLQLQQWVQERPDMPAPSPGVGLRPGQRVTLTEAHARLQALTNAAKAKPTQRGRTDHITDSGWIKVTELAECILCAVPNDPVALSALAEVEHAHGHTDFAVTYLRHAMKAMGATTNAEAS